MAYVLSLVFLSNRSFRSFTLLTSRTSIDAGVSYVRDGRAGPDHAEVLHMTGTPSRQSGAGPWRAASLNRTIELVDEVDHLGLSSQVKEPPFSITTGRSSSTSPTHAANSPSHENERASCRPGRDAHKIQSSGLRDRPQGLANGNANHFLPPLGY